MLKLQAKVAQLVEHNLAKVGVASSNLVFRSSHPIHANRLFNCLGPKPNAIDGINNFQLQNHTKNVLSHNYGYAR